MKKGFLAFLALTLIVGNPLSVNANDQDDESHVSVSDGADQTVDLVAGGEPEADVVVNARLGRRDNTIANPDLPVGDERWINVTLPTVVIFHSNWDVDVEELTSPTYQIANHSYMGLSIFIDDFRHLTNEASASYIENLHIVVAENSVRLMDNDGISIGAENLLVTMVGNGGTQHDYEPSVVTFGFAGNLENVPEETIAQPTFNLILTFESVARSGHGVEAVAFDDDFEAFQRFYGYEQFVNRLANFNQGDEQQVDGGSSADMTVSGILDDRNNQVPQPSEPDQPQPPDSEQDDPEPQPPGAQTPPDDLLPQTGSVTIGFIPTGLGMVFFGILTAVTGKKVKN